MNIYETHIEEAMVKDSREGFHQFVRVYLNWKGPDGRETVDEFDTRKEALEMVPEYHMAGMNVYISMRPCANWKD